MYTELKLGVRWRTEDFASHEAFIHFLNEMIDNKHLLKRVFCDDLIETKDQLINNICQKVMDNEYVLIVKPQKQGVSVPRTVRDD